MSYELMRAVIEHSETTGSARTALMMLAFYARPGQNLVWPSNQTLMRDFGVPERTLQRALRVAEEKGEARRQPQAESRDRPRVYLVDPMFRRQPELPGLGDGCQTEVDGRLTGVVTPVSSRAPAYGSEEALSDNPPSPPTGGSGIESFRLGLAAPRRARLEGVAAARRRRRRRREVPAIASEPCPLGVMTEREAALLAEEVRTLEHAFRAAVGPESRLRDFWDVWLDGVHGHVSDPERLVVGLAPERVAWVQSRIGRILPAAIGREVLLVPCLGVPAVAASEVAGG